ADRRRPLVALGRHITTALLDGDVEGEAATRVQGGDVEIGVEDLDVGLLLDVASGYVGRAAGIQPKRHRLVGVDAQHQVFEVQDDVGDVFLDPGDGGELVEGVVEAQLGDGGAGDRRQQRAAQRVSEGVAEAGLEGADDEPLAVLLALPQRLDGGALDDQHGYSYLL